MTTTVTKTLAPSIETALAAVLSPAYLPDMVWLTGDDKCECTYQRIGQWTNPYLAETIEYRWCCIWKTFLEMFPQLRPFYRETPAYWDDNASAWVREPRPWDARTQSDDAPGVTADMPLSLWHRQLARQEGKSVADIRREYAGREHERPKGRVYTRAYDQWRLTQQPGEAVVKAALIARLKATGWILS